MALRVQIPRKASLVRFFLHPWGRIAVAALTFVVILGLATFALVYMKYARMIEEKLGKGPFEGTAMIFAAPQTISVGDRLEAEEVLSYLASCGYTELQSNRMGWYHQRPDAVEIFPGPDSYFAREPGVVKFADGRVAEVISLADNTPRSEYSLEPRLITNLFDRNRGKRRLVRFQDLPEHLVNAVVAIEDKRFFHHSGFDPLRVIKAAWVDLSEARIAEGASTLSMQLARSLWLDTSRTWRRKSAEVLITFHLERKLTKEQIFEYYANQIYLGRRGSFSIHGFGEGAQAYFDKDVRSLTLPEAALLAGIIQRPSAFNPYRSPERARKRRDLVLEMMRDNGYITGAECAEAMAAPVEVAAGGLESTDAPYFVDLVNNELQRRLQDHDFQSSSYRVYTTLDLDLQRDAAEAVRTGMQEVDERLRKQKRFRHVEAPPVQVALVAMDPRTGAIRALVGGRNYGFSQLNHAVARRQPGSIFKPFVFVAALNSILDGGPQVFTPTSTVVDEPTTFWFDDKPYEPSNFGEKNYGTVTLRDALAHSINIATVKFAELVGYDRVAEMARRAGLGEGLIATPAMALGAYEATPIEMAGAYTVFSNEGVYSQPNWIAEVRDLKGNTILKHQAVQSQALDPRVAYQMVNLMEGVLNHGTGAGARARGFVLPAAGKTGTSHDGWFAGFTSNLICVVWVGFDDNSELYLEGAKSALPIWTEFMKRAHARRAYRAVRSFQPPAGIVTVELDRATGLLASPGCGESRPEAFIAGTEPMEVCGSSRPGSAGTTLIASWEAPATPETAPAAASLRPSKRPAGPAAASPAQRDQAPPAAAATREKRKGLFRRILDIFK